jgi:hypothetical protein
MGWQGDFSVPLEGGSTHRIDLIKVFRDYGTPTISVEFGFIPWNADSVTHF